MQDNALEGKSNNANRDDGVVTHTLKNQLKINNEMILAALVCYDDTDRIIEELCRKAQIKKRQRGLEDDLVCHNNNHKLLDITE